MTYKLIQREPTREMVVAAENVLQEDILVTRDWKSLVKLLQRAMWDAAPQVINMPPGWKLQPIDAAPRVAGLPPPNDDELRNLWRLTGKLAGKDWAKDDSDTSKNIWHLRHFASALLAAHPSQSTAAQEAKDSVQPDWKTFAAKVLQASREHLSDVDGGDIQDWAVESGLLVAQMQTETCGEECRCAEYGTDLPWECFRYSPEAEQVVAALSTAQAKEIK